MLMIAFVSILILLNLNKIDSVHQDTNNNRDHGIVNFNTLKMVILIHRHGDRNPIETYPRDPFSNQTRFWPDGWGQLTLKGKKRMYNLGKYLSKRYGKFLGNSPREVQIRSSATDRCLESVSLILAGLYPPTGRWKWNDDLGQKWQPFPIQTVPHETDGMLNPGSKCGKAEELEKEIYRSKEVVDYYQKMKPTLDYVQDNAGYQTTVDLIKAEQIFDCLLIEKEANYVLPAWVDDSVYHKLEQISDKTFVFSSMTRQIQKFRTGLLIEDIWKHFQELNETRTNMDRKRLYIYSTHDTQLSVFLSAFQEFNGLAPKFGSSILIEMHQNETEMPFIEMYYLNDTYSEKPYRLNLSICQNWNNLEYTHCTMKNFYLIIEDLIPKNWYQECKDTNDFDSDNSLCLTWYITFAFVLLFFPFFFLYFIIINRRRNMNEYRLLPFF